MAENDDLGFEDDLSHFEEEDFTAEMAAVEQQEQEEDLPLASMIDLPALSEKDFKRAKRKRRMIFWMKASVFMCLMGMVVGLVGVVVAYFYCVPRYNLAQSFDLSELRDFEVASRIFDRNGKEMGRIFVQNRRPIPIEQVATSFKKALVAAEDNRFYEHDGVDYKGIVRAAYWNIRSQEMNQGASTITQQLGRNVFELKERKISRKVVEAFLARRIEAELNSKERILELYMNRIYFGDGYYGIAAASEGFFGKSAKELTLAEAATLAGAIRNPYHRSPRRFPSSSKKTRDQVLEAMFEENLISEAEMLRAQRTAIKTIAKGNVTGKSAFVYEKVRQEVMDLLGKEAASKGGFQIYTTIDGDIQKLAETAIQDRLSKIEQDPQYKHPTLEQYKKEKAAFKENSNGDARPPKPEYLQGALLLIDNKTGAVIAQVGSRDFNDSMFDRTSMGRRPLGTAFLPFVYAAAFEGKFFPGSLLDDSPMDARKVMVGGLSGILGEWGPEDHNNVYEKTITARQALAKSKISSTVRLGMKTGLENVVSLAEQAGMTFEGELKKFNATFLGRNPAAMQDICLAYTIFPNGGRRPEKSHIISSIRDRSGNEIYTPSIRLGTSEIVDRYTAYQVNSVLTDTFEYGVGKEAREKLDLGQYVVAGKSGTEYGFTDNWWIGYTSEVTCAVWAGFDQTKQIFPGAFSSQTVLPVWTRVMNMAADRFEPRAFIPPPDAEQVEVCNHSGELASDGCYETRQLPDGMAEQVRSTYVEYLRPGSGLKRVCHLHRKPGSSLRSLANGPVTGALRALPSIAAASEPVYPVAPTLIAEKDPYNSVIPVVRARVAIVATPVEEEENDADENGLPVARPIFRKEDSDSDSAARVRLPPPRAIIFD